MACVVSSFVVVCRRLSSFVVVMSSSSRLKFAAIGEAFASDFSWMCHVSVCAAIPL